MQILCEGWLPEVDETKSRTYRKIGLRGMTYYITDYPNWPDVEGATTDVTTDATYAKIRYP